MTLMVGRERVIDYYHDSRQHAVGENPVLLEIRGLSRAGKYLVSLNGMDKLAGRDCVSAVGN